LKFGNKNWSYDQREIKELKIFVCATKIILKKNYFCNFKKVVIPPKGNKKF
jgi:hypothetical protein